MRSLLVNCLLESTCLSFLVLSDSSFFMILRNVKLPCQDYGTTYQMPINDRSIYINLKLNNLVGESVIKAYQIIQEKVQLH